MTKHIYSALAVVLALLLATPALAFNNEPDGWDGTGWGVTAESFIKNDKALRKTLKIREVKKTLESQDIVLRKLSTLDGAEVDAQWVFSGDGLHTVILRWQNRRPDAYDAWKAVLAGLEQRWGKAKHVTEEEFVWEGTTSKVVAKKVLAPSGSAVEIRLTRVGNAGSGTIDAKDRAEEPDKPARRGRDLLGDTDSDFP